MGKLANTLQLATNASPVLLGFSFFSAPSVGSGLTLLRTENLATNIAIAAAFAAHNQQSFCERI